MKINLTDSQFNTLLTALVAAQDQFYTDAHASDAANLPRLGKQFRRQADEARALFRYIASQESEVTHV